MEPIEIIVIAAAVLIVAGVAIGTFLKKHKAKKQGKHICGGCCDCCPGCASFAKQENKSSDK